MTYLVENPNPEAKVRSNGKKGWYYPPPRRSHIRVIGLHTGETDPHANSAWNIANYLAHVAPHPASYHRVVDSHNTITLLPDDYTAFGIASLNSPTLHLSWATRAYMWGQHKTWDDAAIERGAVVAAEWIDKYDIPKRILNNQQAFSSQKGFVYHSTADPTRRTDPGQDFPTKKFFGLIDEALRGGSILKLDAEDRDFIRKTIDDRVGHAVASFRRTKDGKPREGEGYFATHIVHGDLNAREANARTKVIEAMLEEAMEGSGIDIDDLSNRVAERIDRLTGESVVDALVERLSREAE